MSRLDIEFMDESCGFVSMYEDLYEKRLLYRIENKDYSNLSAREYEQLSSKRKNVLMWYPFKEGAKLLELGGGFGALTELFVERRCVVTSVEHKKSRAEIIKRRLENQPNLQVICANPVLYETEEKFDYIIVHDIWGYIKKYNPSVTNAYDIFLQKVKGYLKDEGHFIVIADNRMALRYFSGSVDEYSKKLFVGVNGYKNYSFIKSFDKKELLDLFEKNDVTVRRIYYSNSDYYFADKIYTDKALERVKYIGKKTGTSYSAFSFFDEQAVSESLQSNGIVDRFVDTFILDCSLDMNTDDEMVFYQAGSNENCGRKIFSLEGKWIEKLDDSQSANEITIEQWNDLVQNYSAADDEMQRYIKKTVRFPYVDPVEILSVGIKYQNQDMIGESQQLIEEENIIKGIIGDLYGD